MPLDAALGDDALDLLSGGGSTLPLPLSTPGLLGAALIQLYAEEGAPAVWTRVAELRRLHESLQAATDRGDAPAAADLAARARAEELRIVLETLGNGATDQALGHAGQALARLRLQIADGSAAGADFAPVAAAAAAVETMLAEAEAARQAGNAEAALDAATRAVSAVNDARLLAAELAGTPTVERLFARALARVAAAEGDAAAEALGAPHRQLMAEARAALIGGRADAAQGRLAAARAEAIRVAIATLGADMAEDAVSAVTQRLRRAQAGITAARSTGVDVAGVERMERSAVDLEMRAASALRSGDAAAALDLASHAAGLVDEILVRLAIGR